MKKQIYLFLIFSLPAAQDKKYIIIIIIIIIILGPLCMWYDSFNCYRGLAHSKRDFCMSLSHVNYLSLSVIYVPKADVLFILP